MERTFSPRTVALVALASLALGFLLVFGGGMWALRPRAREHTAHAEPASPNMAPAAVGFVTVPDGGSVAPVAPAVLAPTVAAIADAGLPTDLPTPGGPEAPQPAAQPVTAAGITIAPASISRCFNQGPPTPIPGGQCDALAGLNQHFAAKAADIAACARAGSHGRLALVLEFRFSTSYMRGWGSPTSNVPNPGVVAACVKRVISPLPFASIPHEHDRYLTVVAIDW